jgi:hypothetical protein
MQESMAISRQGEMPAEEGAQKATSVEESGKFSTQAKPSKDTT